MDHHATLMACAVEPGNPAVLALAGVLASAYERHGLGLLPLPGLAAHPTRRLLLRWFPGAEDRLGLDWPALADAARAEPRADEIDDLVLLLRDYADPRAGWAEEAGWLAHALACASLGHSHLWQDLRLPSRRELSALMTHWFPRLAAKNDRDMKWKKFLYKQLCEREELFICKAPTCGVCTDHALCFGPEDAAAAAPVTLPVVFRG